MMLSKETQQSINGLTLHTIESDKYKTNTIVLKLKAPLEADYVTQRALLPYVLQSETSKHPTSTQLRSYLDELYGATLQVDLSKKGEYHIITLRMEIANEKFLSDQTPLLNKALELLSEIIFSPVVENGSFSTTTLDKEKRTLRQRIEAVFDDKMRYSNLRLIQEMCKDEPYELHVNGRIEDIDAISPTSLYEYYQKVLREDQVDLYVVGNIQSSEVAEVIEKRFPFDKRESYQELKLTTKTIEKVNEVIEADDVKQGKLNIGYRTNVYYGDDDYNALQVFNGLFGGFSHSKLFVNVREKESLAYYAASRVESHKGLLMVMSGIEFKNYERAVTIINEQMDAMCQGEFTDQDIDQTKAVIKNQLLETIDTARGMVEVFYQNAVTGKSNPINEWLEGIDSVSKKQIIEVANKIQQDTIYFLKGSEVAD
ncbi:insulinase family protein [Bacillus luteolus]|uniref:Insulinase family protein n=1 Tax=Litchfieldia luteola TaxID=682179 RepID=A0ABR9QJJ5_9BACI|nr:pitrilysin family protein [Cytobacillus luteolus]MBE4908665.1 insulinase family protein [Cytobacillus luteolus]MBP1941522.1 putative Zn-dependent peptidase [Cytobacillus luteolus]